MFNRVFQHQTSTSWRRVMTAIWSGYSVLSIAGCSLADLVSQAKLPPDQRDPNALKNPEGAIAAYNATILGFSSAIGAKSPTCDSCSATQASYSASYIYVVGLLTDELTLVTDANNAQNGFPTSAPAAVDSRTASENDLGQAGATRGLAYKDVYAWLQTVRARAREARGALQKYVPTSPPALLGHLYALEGYAEVLLAELFCSGIPLSTLQFEGDFAYTRGFSSDEVYQHAVTLFDSALTLSADSARIMHFANMGRSRALLGLGEYNQAAQGVASVPNDYQYLLRYTATRPNLFLASLSTANYPANESFREGTNGLPYWGDPRSDTVRTTASAANFRMIPRKFLPAGTVGGTVIIGGVTYNNYVNNGTAPIPVATGVEAQLIKAEAALRAGTPTWLTILNQLRTTCVTTVGCPTPAPAGTGTIAGLPPLTDPGTDSARVSLLFRERAHWLFLTGYRQGDLRRMVRQYGRLQEEIYPIGAWGPDGVAPYGTDTNAPVPLEEQRLNPLYGGCINRDA